MSTIMIVGATRGIGLELTKQYSNEGNQVIACARDTGNSSLLDEVFAFFYKNQIHFYKDYQRHYLT